MRILNATDINGNPYLTIVTIGSAVDSAVENALESGGYLDGLVKTEVLEDYAKTEDLEDYARADDLQGLVNQDELDAFVKDEELQGKLENLGIFPGGGNAGKKIMFSDEDSEEVSWSGNIATFTHNLNCIPAVVLFDDDDKQVLAEIAYVDGDTFTIDFQDKNAITGTWTAVICYAGQASSSAPVEP